MASDDKEIIPAGPPDIYIPDVNHLVKMVETVENAKNQVLSEGLESDYAVIPGTSKPTLLKPGAEKLCQLFGYRIKSMNLESEQEQPYGVRYKCTLHDGQGRIVGECDGWADAGERKARGWDRNTLLKMAQKRAFVGAVLWATGASALFTQDMEDSVNPRDDLNTERVPGQIERESTPADKKRTETDWGKEKLKELDEWWIFKHVDVDPDTAKKEVRSACKSCGFKNSDELAKSPTAVPTIQRYLLTTHLPDGVGDRENGSKDEQQEASAIDDLVTAAKAKGWTEEGLWELLQEFNITSPEDLTQELSAELMEIIDGVSEGSSSKD